MPDFDDRSIRFRAATPNDADALYDLWSRSVRATHDFLAEADFQAIARQVREDYLPGAGFLLAEVPDAKSGGCILGFMGMTGRNIDALFIDPAAFGRGIGRALIARAEEAGEGDAPLTLDVNEQNPGARTFYERLGFLVTGRSETDDDGRPYPLLHLRRAG